MQDHKIQILSQTKDDQKKTFKDIFQFNRGNNFFTNSNRKDNTVKPEARYQVNIESTRNTEDKNSSYGGDIRILKKHGKVLSELLGTIVSNNSINSNYKYQVRYKN